MAAKFNIEGISLGSLCLEKMPFDVAEHERESEERWFNSGQVKAVSLSLESLSAAQGTGIRSPHTLVSLLLL